MDEDRAETVRGWRSRSVEGYAGLHRLAGEEFSGVIETDRGSTRAFMTNGAVVGIAGGDVDDLDGASMTAYAAPGDAIPLLFAMQAQSGDPRAQYYTEETPLSEVNDTLEQGGFTGYVELSENVLSGDYYVVYHGGRSSSVAFVGNAPRLLTDEEAFDRAADEVGIYTVYDVDVSVIDVPGGGGVEHATDAGSAVVAGDEGDATDPDDDGGDGTASDGSAGAAGTSGDLGPGRPTGEATDSDGGVADPGTTTAAPSSTTTDSDGDESGQEDRSIRGVGDAGTGSGSSAGTGPYSGGEEIRVGAGLGLDEDVADADGPTDDPDSGPEDVADGPDHAGGRAADDEASEPPGADASGVAPPAEGTADTATGEEDPPGTGGTAVDPPAEESIDADPPDQEAEETGAAHVDREEGTSTARRGNGTSADRGEEVADPTGEGTAEVSIGSGGGGASPRTDGDVAGATTEEVVDASADSSSGGATERADGTPTREANEGAAGRTAHGGSASADDGGTDSAVTDATDQPVDDDPAPGTGATHPPDGDDGSGRTATPDRDGSETELAGVREERDALETELREARDALARVRGERDDSRAEADRLRERIERLEERIDRLEAGGAAGDAGADAPGRSLARADALADTNLFVRYGSKAEPTLETAHKGDADPDDVNRNLRIEHHTRFEAEDVVVDGEPFESFLTSSFEYQFVEWVIRGLLYELRSTGNRAGMEQLYDAIPAIDRIQFDGAVEVGDGGDAREFDVIFRDGMGEPLLVANLHESRDPTEDGAVTTLIEDTRTVAVATETIGSAFVVTRSYYEPPALEAASDATGGGFLSRSRYESYVKMDRKRGFHLCLVEARDGEFNLRIPEL